MLVYLYKTKTMKKLIILSMMVCGTLLFSQSQKQFIQNLETYLNFRTIFEQSETKFDYLETLRNFSYTSHYTIPPSNPKYTFDKACNFNESNVTSIDITSMDKGMVIIIRIDSKKCKSTIQKNGEFPTYEEKDFLSIQIPETSREDNNNIITLLKGAFPSATINIK